MKGPRFLPSHCQLILSAVCFVSLASDGCAQNVAKKPPTQAEQADLNAMNAKVDGIILPQVKFDKTPLPDALEQLRAAARDNDKATDPAAKGVNIFFKLKPNATTPTTPITLDLKSVSLKTALEALAKQAGLDVAIERYAVSLKVTG